MTTPAEARDEAMARADEHADKLWKTTVDRCIPWVARRKPTLTADDIWDAMETHAPGITTHEPRALGPRMMVAVRAGSIEPMFCGECGSHIVTPSKRTELHASLLHVFRSKLYREDA